LITGAATPLFKLNSKMFFRSAIWCWLIPVTSFCFYGMELYLH
jgi:hypothetical protein